MAIGMTYEQYWYGDPLMVRAYYKANKFRQERIDAEAWLYGSYVLNALDATIGNMFRKSSEQPAEYPKEPHMLEKKKRDKLEKAEKDKEQEATWAQAWMTSFVQAGKNWGNKKG